jgi:ATP-dependent Clp protease protease subunit
LLAEHTGKSEADIERDTERDNFMSAEQSVDYGIMDKVLTSRANPDETAATE